MDNWQFLGLWLGMMIVTALPRVAAVFAADGIAGRPTLAAWLEGIPFAAFGALVFPGVFGIAGIPAPAAALALLAVLVTRLMKVNLLGCMVVSVVVTYFMAARG